MKFLRTDDLQGHTRTARPDPRPKSGEAKSHVATLSGLHVQYVTLKVQSSGCLSRLSTLKPKLSIKCYLERFLSATCSQVCHCLRVSQYTHSIPCGFQTTVHRLGRTSILCQPVLLCPVQQQLTLTQFNLQWSLLCLWAYHW